VALLINYRGNYLFPHELPIFADTPMNYQLDQNRASNNQSYTFSSLPSVRGVILDGQRVMCASRAVLQVFFSSFALTFNDPNTANTHLSQPFFFFFFFNLFVFLFPVPLTWNETSPTLFLPGKTSNVESRKKLCAT
jgi:hypothetical protein